jgi:hypothetical protein
VLGAIKSILVIYKTPTTLTGMWSYGFMSFIFLLGQIKTGLILLTQYIPEVNLAAKTIEVIMRDVPRGWLFRFDLGTIIVVMGSLDPMIFTGLAVVSAAIAAYNLYKIIEERNEEELRREAAQARREAAAQARREAAQNRRKAAQARREASAKARREAAQTRQTQESSEEDLAEQVPNMTEAQLNELLVNIADSTLETQEQHLKVVAEMINSPYDVWPEEVFVLVEEYHTHIITELNAVFKYTWKHDAEFVFLEKQYFTKLLELLEARYSNFANPDPEWEPVLSRMFDFALKAEEYFRTNSNFDRFLWLFNDLFYGYGVNPEPVPPSVIIEPVPEWDQVFINTGVSFPCHIFFYSCTVILGFWGLFSTNNEYFSWQWHYWWTFIKNLGQQNYLNLKILLCQVRVILWMKRGRACAKNENC